MRDRQFQRLRQEHRDAVAARKTVGLQHIGKTARHLATSSNEVRVARAVLIDIDQRQTAGAIGMAVAARGRDVEPRRDVPAEVAVEFVVVGGFGEHGHSVSSLTFVMPALDAGTTFLLAE